MKKKKSFKRIYKRRSKKAFYKKRPFKIGLLGTVIVFVFSYFLFFSQIFWVEKIKVLGIDGELQEEIKRFVEEESISSILFFQTRAISLLQPSKVSNNILETYPLINSVVVDIVLPDTIIIKTTKREPIALWCSDACFKIDKYGVIFKESEKSEKPIIDSTKIASLGETVIEKDIMIPLIEILKELEDFQISRIDISTPTIRITTREGWDILFVYNQSILDQITKLRMTIKEKIPIDKIDTLNYIDLRFDDRVFFKFQSTKPKKENLRGSATCATLVYMG